MDSKVYQQKDIVEIIAGLLRKYGAESGVLFGSYARQDAGAHSDIDLLVIGGVRFDPTDVFSIADDLHRATGKNVDVYELREIERGSALYQTIFSEGVRIA